MAAACQTVPYTERRQVLLLSEDEENKMGVDVYKEIVGKAKISTDPAVNELVTRVGRRIVQATGKNYPWEFTVIDDPKSANAFALPGGKVAVYTGMLSITKDEAGLAAVLGHEISHVIARHNSERVSEQMVAQGLVGIGGSVVGLDQKTSEAIGGLFISTLLLPFSRQQESEADHLGLIYMAQAGYDPHAARDLWIRMAAAYQGNSRPPQFLSTHPSEQTRIQQIERWLPEALKYYRPTR
jgi:metalloendopeptidase OMA1, mitochondrial